MGNDYKRVSGSKLENCLSTLFKFCAAPKNGSIIIKIEAIRKCCDLSSLVGIENDSRRRKIGRRKLSRLSRCRRSVIVRKRRRGHRFMDGSHGDATLCQEHRFHRENVVIRFCVSHVLCTWCVKLLLVCVRVWRGSCRRRRRRRRRSEYR